MNIKKILMMKGWLLVLSTFLFFEKNLMADGCPVGHCSTVAKKVKKACEKRKEEDEKNGRPHIPGNAFFTNPTDPDGDLCYCPCSCYAEGTEILSNGSTVPVESVGQSASLTTPLGEIEVIKAKRSDVKDHPALQLDLENGKSLKVSTNHPFIIEGGQVIEARDLVVGAKLLQENGDPLAITKVMPIRYTGTFYNFQMDGRDESGADRIVISEGVRSGDETVQSYRNFVNRNIELRELMINISNDKE